MTTANNTLPEPIAAPGAAPTTNAQPVATNAPQAAPDTVAGAPNASQSNPTQAGGIESAARFKDPNWARRLRPQQPLIGIPKAKPITAKPITAEPRMAEPRVGEHDLLVQGSIKLTSRAGIVVEIPFSTMLSGALTPAFIPLAQQQFETLLDQLLIKPVTIAFIAFLEDVKAARKADADKTKIQRAAELEKEQDAMRDILNHK